MKMLISSDTLLRQFIPNALVTVQGEQSLFEKLHIELQLSEQWLTTRILGDTLRTSLETAASSSETLTTLANRIIATDAFIRAIPSLDLVLTPNGFGVVNNTTLSPASRDRVERLLTSLTTNRDFAIDALLQQLLPDTAWRSTPQGQYFLATLFPTLSSLNIPATQPSSLWERYTQVHPSLVLIEQELAEQYISPTLYARLRTYLPTADEPQEVGQVLSLLRAIELDLLQGKPLPYQQLTMLVDFIRTRPAVFPEWQTSATAQLFQPHAFENKKSSSGYWF